MNKKLQRWLGVGATCIGLVMAVFLGTIAIPTQVQAGAATASHNVVPAPGNNTWTPVTQPQGLTPQQQATWNQDDPYKGTSAHELAIEAKKAFVAQEGKESKPGNQSNASVHIYWFTDLLVLSHADLHSVLLNAWVQGYVSAMTLVCATIGGLLGGPIGALFVGAVCAFILSIVSASILSGMAAAYNAETWYTPFSCGHAGVWYPGSACWYPNARVNSLGYWIATEQVTGFNVLFTWGGVPIAWQANPYSG